MNNAASEHPYGSRRRLSLLAIEMLALLCAALAAPGALAQGDPPQPDFYWPYGQVQLDGANIQPAGQRIIAIVHGRACGEGNTLVPVAGPGVPPEDVGKTAYVVDVLHDGTGAGQRPGCGMAGAAVNFYFPELGRFAVQQPGFVVGTQRVDLDLGAALSVRMVVPLVAGDGVN